MKILALFTCIVPNLYDFHCFVEQKKEDILKKFSVFFSLAHTMKINGVPRWFVLDLSGFHCLSKNS